MTLGGDSGDRWASELDVRASWPEGRPDPGRGGLGARRKILILMADTGGGHRSAAQALAEAFVEQEPTVEVVSVDALRHHAPFPINYVHLTYRPLVNHGRWLWAKAWYLTSSARRVGRVQRLLRPVARRRLAALYRSQRPDLVVSVHPLLTHVPLGVLRQTLPGVPFAIVVTDLVSVHPAWLCPEADLVCVPTEAAGRLARAAGLPEERVRVLGLPVGRKFVQTAALLREGKETRSSLRRRLGLSDDLPVVLLSGGGEGLGPVYRIVQALAVALGQGGEPAGQLVVVCGRNRALQRRLEDTRWPIPVHVTGFVTNMPEWMGAADLLITKAGPGTISEALVMGLPILLYGYVPGQEEGNVPYVVEQGVGAYEPDPFRLAARVAGWLQDGDPTLMAMAARARVLAKPHAAGEIARALLKLPAMAF